MTTVGEFKRQVLDNFNRQECFAYFGDLDPEYWGQLGFAGQHRDSDALTRSNHEVIVRDLTERFPESFRVEGSSHWAVGWMDVVRIDTRDDAAVVAAMDWAYALDQYPVADDEHYSKTEHEEDQEWYRCGGREEMIEAIGDDPEFSQLFDEDGELLPEFEDALNEGFHRAMSHGDHTALPDAEYVLEAMGDALSEKEYWDRIAYERAQPPFEGV